MKKVSGLSGIIPTKKISEGILPIKKISQFKNTLAGKYCDSERDGALSIFSFAAN